MKPSVPEVTATTAAARVAPVAAHSGPVLHVIPLLWSGAGAYVTRLCELQALTRDVRIVTASVSSGERDWPEFRRRLRRAGVAHHRIDLFRRAPEVFWPAVDRLRSVLVEMRPAVVHVHAGVPATAAAMALGDLPRPPAMLAQFQNWGLGRPAWMNAMDLWGFRRADLVVVGAAASRRVMEGGGITARRIRRLRLGVEMPAAADHHLAARSPVIGFIGRIEPRKAQVDLVRMLREVRRRRPDLTLELVGPPADASYSAELDREVRRLGLTSAVRRTGHVADVTVFLRRWRALVSASLDEGQGLAVVEAMAHGTPVVARRAPGVEDTLRDPRRGVLVEERGADALGRAVVRLLDDEPAWEAVSRHGRAWARRHHGWSRCVRSLDRLYAEAQRLRDGVGS